MKLRLLFIIFVMLTALAPTISAQKLESDRVQLNRSAVTPTAPTLDHFIYLPLVTRQGPPGIVSFSAHPATIAAGETSTLSWNISGATSISISGIGAVTGSTVDVHPITTTQYTLTALNGNGTTIAKTTVTVASHTGFQFATFLMPYTLNNVVTVSGVPQVAVDHNGGVHVIYTSVYPDNSGVRPAYYAYCSANCDQKANFSVVALGDAMSFAQLALDPQGHPRVMLTTWPPSNANIPFLHWTYGACNSNCTSAGSWTLTEIAAAGSYTFWPDVLNNQSFALDAQGHPRLLYYANPYGAEPNAPTGTLLTYCDTTCTNAGNWTTNVVYDGEWNNLALTLTSAGQPRFAFTYNLGAPDYQWGLAYAECSDVTCSSGSSNLIVTNDSSQGFGSATFALRLDAQDRPRIAYYPGYSNDGTLPGTRLYYLTCNANCTQANTWQAVDIGLPTHESGGTAIFEGESGVDLALDQQGRPRIAFRMGFSLDELGYTWCNSDCATSPNGWSYQVLWSTAAQTAELGHPPREGCPDCLPPIPPCPLGFWDAGYWPSIALDSNGNPRIVYEIQEQSGGGFCEAKTWARMTRFAIFNQP